MGDNLNPIQGRHRIQPIQGRGRGKPVGRSSSRELDPSGIKKINKCAQDSIPVGFPPPPSEPPPPIPYDLFYESAVNLFLELDDFEGAIESAKKIKNESLRTSVLQKIETTTLENSAIKAIESGELDKARDLANKIQNIDIKNSITTSILIENNQFDEAMKTANQIKNRDIKNSLLATIYIAQDNPEKAAEKVNLIKDFDMRRSAREFLKTTLREMPNTDLENYLKGLSEDGRFEIIKALGNLSINNYELKLEFLNERLPGNDTPEERQILFILDHIPPEEENE